MESSAINFGAERSDRPTGPVSNVSIQYSTMDFEDILRTRYRNARICAACVEEPDLEAYIRDADGDPGCAFCERDDAPTCDFLDFMGHIHECIEGEYEWAANCLPWESAGGGWLWGPVWDTYELVTDELGIGLPRDENRSLLEGMIDCLGGNQEWCVSNPYSEDPLDVLRTGWKRFCTVVQHHTRFFLDRWAPPSTRSTPDGDAYPTPGQLLHAIGDRISRLELYRELPVNTRLYRVRHCKDGYTLKTPAELGPPRPDQAVVTNRMSPAGIVMFYSAMDPETAIAETVNEAGHFAIGEFRTRRAIWLADFTQLPSVPGRLARIPDSQPWGRRDAQFFHDLVADFTRPIARDDRVHIEYIPTQVVTEYCRLAFHQEFGTEPLDGILYPSARKPGHTAVVLFADRKAIAGIEPLAAGETDRTWLESVGVRYRDLTEIDVQTLKSLEGANWENANPIDFTNGRKSS